MIIVGSKLGFMEQGGGVFFYILNYRNILVYKIEGLKVGG